MRRSGWDDDEGKQGGCVTKKIKRNRTSNGKRDFAEILR